MRQIKLYTGIITACLLGSVFGGMARGIEPFSDRDPGGNLYGSAQRTIVTAAPPKSDGNISAVQNHTGSPEMDGSSTGPTGGAQLFFPNEGTINAFYIFVQHRNDRYDNELTTDPETEWPSDRSPGRDRKLPGWAGKGGEKLIAAPGTPPSRFPEGSISQFYYLMSGGRFTLTGDVYPRVYIPEHDKSWYLKNAKPFKNGAVRLSHEILTSDEIKEYIARKYPGDEIDIFDRYTNGTSKMEPDGVFDMVVLVYRLSDLPGLIGLGRGYTSITSFGEFSSKRGDSFADAEHPVKLGKLKVIDNLKSGSGVIVEGYTLKSTVRITAHEIGHRQLYYAHTCGGSGVSSRNSECVGIMGGPYLTMSAPDRMKLGWAEIETIDVSQIDGVMPYVLEDALKNGKVLRLRDGDKDGCGDVIAEARTWSNFWDRPPDGKNDDGDHGDFYLPQEGLYLYKAPGGGNGCGGRQRFYSSLESNGEKRDPNTGFRNGSTYQVAFGPGDSYTPSTEFRFDYHRNPTLDQRLSITDITRTRDGFRFFLRNGGL